LRDGFTTVAFGKGPFAQAWLASVAGRFFTSRVTRARREAAAALGAEVISDPRVLLLRVGLAPEVKDPTAPAVLSALLDSKWEFRTRLRRNRLRGRIAEFVAQGNDLRMGRRPPVLRRRPLAS
jgi:hypothetical protein